MITSLIFSVGFDNAYPQRGRMGTASFLFTYPIKRGAEKIHLVKGGF